MEKYRGIIYIGTKKIDWETTFSKDIKFKCANSGLCCMATNVELLKGDIKLLQEGTIKDFFEKFVNPITKLESSRIKYSDKKDCIFLVNNKCSVYNYRPHSCRLFPFKIVVYNENKVFIDIIYGCKSLVSKYYSDENLIDYGNMVKNELELLKRLKFEINATAELKDIIEKYHVKFEYARNIVKMSFEYFENLDTLNNLYLLLSSLQAIKIKLKENLGEYELFDLGLKFCKDHKDTVGFNNSEIEGFLKNVFFKGFDLSKDLRFKININDKIYFNYINNDLITFDTDSLNRIDDQLANDVKRELSQYLLNIIKRKYPEIAFFKEIKIYGKDIDVVTLFIEIYKYIIKHLNCLILISSLRNNGKITTNDIKESILLYDNIALNAPYIFLPQILKK